MNTRKKASTGRLWIRLIKDHRALRDITVPCRKEDPLTALREAMHELDLGMPIWLPRHQMDWKSFALTKFTQDHFMEAINFDRMEMSYIAPDEERKPPKFTEDN